MKSLKRTLQTFSFIFLLLSVGCTDEIMDEIDTDPNNPENVAIELLLPQVTSGVAYNVASTDLAWYAAMFSEQLTGVNGTMADYDKRLGITPSISDNAWLYIYAGTLNNLRIIIEKGSEGGSEEGNWVSVGIAKVLYAYTMGIVTDMWGKVPDTDALRGGDSRYPVFDNQQDIYTHLFQMIDDAIADFDKETNYTVGSEDLIYEGDASKWKQAAYALKARLLNHLSKQDTELTYTQEIIECVSNSFTQFEVGDDIVEMKFRKYTALSTQSNPWFQEQTNKGSFAVSETFYNLLVDLAYPNKEYLISKVGNEMNAAPNGEAENDPSGTIYSKISENILTATSPVPLLTYSELKFIEAEAELRLADANGGNHRANAYEAYQAAITATLFKRGFDNPVSISNYMELLPQENDLTIEDVIQYKYVALWPFNAIEAYTDWRRTAYPALNNPIVPPRRLPYPQSEISANPDNCTDNSGQLQNGVWWDDGTDD